MRTERSEVLRSAPREGAFDERCGAFRCRFHGLAAARVRSGRARGRRDRRAVAGGGTAGPSGSLEERAAAATLELYSLEAQLGRARTELADIEARRATLARERASARTPAGGGQAGAAGVAERALRPRPRSLPAVGQRSARRRARRQVARGGARRPRRHQPRGRPEQPDRRAGADGAYAAHGARRRGSRSGTPSWTARGRGGGPRGIARGDGGPAPRAHRRAAAAAGSERGAHRGDRGAGARRPRRGRRPLAVAVAAAPACSGRDGGADRHSGPASAR